MLQLLVGIYQTLSEICGLLGVAGKGLAVIWQ
jgi:hypothetical protein